MTDAAQFHMVWLHGLGQKGKEKWGFLETDISQQLFPAKMRWHFPQAPAGPVSAWDGQSSFSWMDQPLGWPVSFAEIQAKCTKDPRLAKSIKVVPVAISDASSNDLNNPLQFV